MKKQTIGKTTSVASVNAASGSNKPQKSAASLKAKSLGSRRSKATSVASAAAALGGGTPLKARIEYLNLTAREVFVAGTFNQWNPLATALAPRSEGKWEIELALEPGRYEYRLVVDGQWTEDPKSTEYIANPFGGFNSVLQVESPS